MKNFITSVLTYSLIFSLTFSQAYGYEDCVITSSAKLTNIKIEHNDIIDVYPLVTIMNDKNTLIVHPLKEGSTKFSVDKNKKHTAVFEVTVTPNETKIKDVSGFDIFNLDSPPETYAYHFDLDKPPVLKEYIQDAVEVELDEPPMLRERSK